MQICYKHSGPQSGILPELGHLNLCYTLSMNSSHDTDFMIAAFEQAKNAKNTGDLPFGAVVVCNGHIIGRGKCEDGTTGAVTDHAELLALREACRTLQRNELSDCTIYCTNEPCPMCAAGIFQAKIPEVVVGLVREDLPLLLRPRKIRMNDLAEDSGYKIHIRTGILKDEILELFKDVKKK